MKNIEIINNLNNLNDLVGADKIMPVKVGYSITKNLKALHKEAQDFEEERKKIVGDDFESKPDENKKEIESKVKELLDYETDISIHKITIEDLEKCETLTTKDIMILDFMIQE